MTRRVLLVGTSFSAAPMARILKSQGSRVAVCGALPEDPCVAWADEYFQFDYSDPDKLLALVEQEAFDALCPSCNDYSYLSSAAVAQRLGYPGFDSPEATTILSDKGRFRAFLQASGLPAPRALPARAEASSIAALAYPLLVKPTDSFSGRGVTRIEDPQALGPAVALAEQSSRQAEAVVEEYIEGSLHSHSAFLHRQEIQTDFFVDEFCTVYPYQVNCSNIPSRLGPVVREQMRECIHELARRLKLADGLLHTQFIVRAGEIFLIECMRRCPGDLYNQLVSYSTGAAYLENYLRPFLGEPTVPEYREREEPWARHTISLASDAIVWSIGHRFPSEDVRIYQLRESGSLIRRAPYGKAAIVFARFGDTETLFELTPRLREMISIDSSDYHHADTA